MTRSLNDESGTMSYPVEASSLDIDGAVIVVDADESERRAIAKRIGVPRLDRLRGEFRLKPFAGGIDLRLLLDATAERQCVVTLEPMTETVREDIAMRFEKTIDEAEIDAPDAAIFREPLDGGAIDLGELLVQHLSLSLVPYPRKADADSILAKYRDAASASPFAELKGLVDRDQ